MTGTISKKLRVLALMLMIVFGLCMFGGFDYFAGSSSTVTAEEDAVSKAAKERMLKEAPAIEAYGEIIDMWTDTPGETTFLDSFGGAYIDNNFNLVVKLVNNDVELRDDIKNAVSNIEVVVFECTDISLAALFEKQYEVMISLSASGINAAETSINVLGSKVNVRVNASQLKSIDSIAEALNDPHIAVIEDAQTTVSVNSIDDSVALSEEVTAVPRSITARLGQALTASDGSYGSLGCYGTFDFDGDGTRENALVTAGHCLVGYRDRDSDVMVGGVPVLTKDKLASEDYVFYRYGNDLADVAGYRRSEGDYAIIRYSNLIRTNELYVIGGNISKYYYPQNEIPQIEHLVGMTLYKMGATMGYRFATISEINVQGFETDYDGGATYGNECKISITGLVRLSPNEDSGRFCNEGDSGGPVFFVDTTGANVLYGFVSAARISDDPGQSHFSNDNYYITPLSLLLSQGFEPFGMTKTGVLPNES